MEENQILRDTLISNVQHKVIKFCFWKLRNHEYGMTLLQLTILEIWTNQKRNNCTESFFAHTYRYFKNNLLFFWRLLRIFYLCARNWKRQRIFSNKKVMKKAPTYCILNFSIESNLIILQQFEIRDFSGKLHITPKESTFLKKKKLLWLSMSN